MADNVLGALFGDIADAIRAKTGDTATMKPIDFPTKISEIQTGGGGGSGDVVGDWETIVEEQTASATYDSTTLSNLMKIPATKIVYHRDFVSLNIYRVWFDGVAYLCAPYNFLYTLSKEVFGVTEARNDIIGNPTLLKGRMLTEMTCEYENPPSEPFAILEANESKAHIAVGDTNPHTVRIDRITRGKVTTS